MSNNIFVLQILLSYIFGGSLFTFLIFIDSSARIPALKLCSNFERKHRIVLILTWITFMFRVFLNENKKIREKNVSSYIWQISDWY